MQWSWASNTPYSVQLDIEAGVNVVLADTPIRAVIVETGAEAIGMNLSGQQLNISFPAVPTTPCTLRIEGNDPGVRNSQGGFLQAGEVALNPLPPLAAFVNLTGDADVTAAMSLSAVVAGLNLHIPSTFSTSTIFCVAANGGAGPTIVQAPNFSTIATVLVGQLFKFEWTSGNWGATQLI